MIRPLRAIVLEAELDASPADVWRALTDAQVLADWFPRKATAAQGVGGVVELAWDDATVWPTAIQVWEPERHLRWVDAMPPGPDGQRQAPMFVDWFISSESGQTVPWAQWCRNASPVSRPPRTIRRQQRGRA